MEKDLKTILKEELDRRNVSIPALARELGIPKHRIYAWYRDDSEPKSRDAHKLQEWLKVEKSEENLTSAAKDQHFTPDQLFAMFLEVTKAQTVILNNIESKMARESTQGQMKISLDRVDKVVKQMSERQEDGIIEFRKRFSKLGAGEEGPLRSTRKKGDHSGRAV